MPDPDRLLKTLRRATQAFRETPGRKGRVVRLQDADEVLITGDLHGNVQNFGRLLAKADLAHHPRRHLVVQEVIHGRYTYAEGGDKSHQMVDLVAALKVQFPLQTHWLLGNHELAQWAGRMILKADKDLNLLFLQGLCEAYNARAEEIYVAYLELFDALPALLLTPNRICLSHSLPRANRLPFFTMAQVEQEDPEHRPPEPGSSVYALVWGRDTDLPTVTAYLEKVGADLLISGHIPIAGGFNLPNDRQIILDSIGTPAGFCLFPTDRPLTHAELVQCVCTI